jgi:hypothetical protein
MLPINRLPVKANKITKKIIINGFSCYVTITNEMILSKIFISYLPRYYSNIQYYLNSKKITHIHNISLPIILFLNYSYNTQLDKKVASTENKCIEYNDIIYDLYVITKELSVLNDVGSIIKKTKLNNRCSIKNDYFYLDLFLVKFKGFICDVYKDKFIFIGKINEADFQMTRTEKCWLVTISYKQTQTQILNDVDIKLLKKKHKNIIEINNGNGSINLGLKYDVDLEKPVCLIADIFIDFTILYKLYKSLFIK